MAILDIILLLCFVPAIVSGLSKGFIRQLVETAALFISVWAAFKFSSVLGTWLTHYLTFGEKTLQILSFIIIVIIVTIVLNILGGLLTKFVKLMMLGWVNRGLGLIFGCFKVALILGVVIILFDGLNSTIHLIRASILEDATVYQHLKLFGTNVFPFLKSFLTAGNV